MRPLFAALVLLSVACSTRSMPDAPLPHADFRYIADYYSATDTLYVRERDGILEAVLNGSVQPLQRVAGDTFTLGNSRVLLGQPLIRLNSLNLQRANVAQGTFRITPLRPVAELRREALAATPPPQPDSLLKPNLVELRSLDPSIKYDIRYATTNNFMGAVFYSAPRAYLQAPAAEAVVRAHRNLQKHGYGLLIHDAYRPWYVTRMFWDGTPDSLKQFVADPRAGSRHNRGAAVDLTMYDLKTGRPVQMPGGYDEFSARSYPHYPGGTTRQRALRELLRSVMEAEGFRVIENEWWHFDYQDWRRYPVANLTFEQLDQR